MYTLYYYPGNANLAPHMVLRELGVPYELVLVDREKNQQKSPDYLKLNPHGRIPTLYDDGLVLYEAAAICLHLAERHPEAGLVPPLGSAERSKFYQILIYLTNTLQAEMLMYFYPERWASGEAATQVKAAAEAHMVTMFDQIESELASHGGPWVLGEQYSLVDPYLFMLARWSRNMTQPASHRPHLRQFQERMSARPAVQRCFADEGIPPPYF